MKTNRISRIPRLGLAALAVILSANAFGQDDKVRYAVSIVGPANANQLPTLGIDGTGRVAGICDYVEDGQVVSRAWTFDPANGYVLSPTENSTINAVSPDGMLVGSANGSPTVFDWLGNPTLVFPTNAGSFMAVNSHHDAAGYVFDPMNGWAQTAVLYDREGNWVRIGAPDMTASAAYGINDMGVVVGYANNPLFECRGFYWSGGMVFLPGLPGNSDVAIGVNNLLGIVGYTVTPTEQVLPVTWVVTPGRIQQTVIDLPAGFNNGFAQAVSDSGQVVGTMWLENGQASRAFVTRGDGSVVDLNDLKLPNARVFTLVSANAINADGTIAGLANVRVHMGGSIQTVAYVARPVKPLAGKGW